MLIDIGDSPDTSIYISAKEGSLDSIHTESDESSQIIERPQAPIHELESSPSPEKASGELSLR